MRRKEWRPSRLAGAKTNVVVVMNKEVPALKVTCQAEPSVTCKTSSASNIN